MQDLTQRYDRQLILQGFGAAAQQRLSQARILVVGCGGLGCPALQYLVAAGVGHLTIADPDRVSLSNLHRQPLFSERDIGRLKVDVARERLQAMNREVDIRTMPIYWRSEHCREYFPHYDLILDATDNFPSRYLINDGAVLAGKPLVMGAVSGYEGQVAVFNLRDEQGRTSVNYRDLFPTPPRPEEAPNCAETGILGVLPGIIGGLQAAEALKVIAGIPDPLTNALLTCDIRTMRFLTLKLSPNPTAVLAMPDRWETFMKTDYPAICGIRIAEDVDTSLQQWLAENPGATLIDIREPDELPRLTDWAAAQQIPLLEIPGSRLRIPENRHPFRDALLVCRSGIRSRALADTLRITFPELRLKGLAGGIIGLFEMESL